MSCFKIFDHNWLFDPSSYVTASSTDTQFPVTNLSEYSRAKIWRSYGYFKITSSNNKLDFNEGAGQVTATITVGEYDTDTLAAAIVSAMETAGVEEYEVNKISSSGKWNISSSGTSFSLLWSSGTNSANSIGSTIGFDTSVDDTGALEYTGAQTANNTEEFIIVDLGTWGTNTVDAFAAVFDSELGPRLTPDAELRLQANQTLNFSAPAIDQVLSINDDWQVVTHYFSSAQTYRYWKFKVVDPQNPLLAIEIPKLFLGTTLAISQEPEIGYVDSAQDTSDTQATKFGNEFQDITPNIRSAEFSWKAITESDKVEFKQFYLRHGQVVPFIIVIDQDETVFNDKDESFLYCRLSNQFSATQSFGTYYDFSVQVREVL